MSSWPIGFAPLDSTSIDAMIDRREPLRSDRAAIPARSTSSCPDAFEAGWPCNLLPRSAFAASILFASLAGAQQVLVGKSDFEICQACHETCAQGTPDLNAPRLAGLEAAYVTRQLEDFRSGRRGAAPGDELGDQMAQMAKLLPDSDAVGRVAHYVSGLSVTAAPSTVKGDVNKGKATFVLCASCHGADGQGNSTLLAPRLAGMSDWYLLRQLESFRAGQRGNGAPDSPAARMRAMSSSLPDDAAVRNVVAYIGTLPSQKLEGKELCGTSRR